MNGGNCIGRGCGYSGRGTGDEISDLSKLTLEPSEVAKPSYQKIGQKLKSKVF